MKKIIRTFRWRLTISLYCNNLSSLAFFPISLCTTQHVDNHHGCFAMLPRYYVSRSGGEPTLCAATTTEKNIWQCILHAWVSHSTQNQSFPFLFRSLIKTISILLQIWLARNWFHWFLTIWSCYFFWLSSNSDFDGGRNLNHEPYIYYELHLKLLLLYI